MSTNLKGLRKMQLGHSAHLHSPLSTTGGEQTPDTIHSMQHYKERPALASVLEVSRLP